MRDSDVRSALHELIAAAICGDTETRVFDEMGIWSGAVRIDVALLNGEMSGFEIKSDQDTLSRLPYQAEIYSKVFDKVTLVVGRKHEKTAVDIIPKWWGVIVARKEGSHIVLRHRRKPRQNKSIETEVLIQMLWKDEALGLLESFGLSRGYRSKNLREIQQRALENVAAQDIKNFVRNALKSRKGWLREQIAN